MSAETKRQRVTGAKPALSIVGKEGAIPSVVNVQAERALIAAVLFEPAIYPALADMVQPADFWQLTHGFIWHAMEQCYPAIDPVTVATAITAIRPDEWTLDDLIAQMTAMIADVPDVAAAEGYAAIVRESALRLRMLQAADEQRRAILDKSLAVDALIDTCNSLLFRASEQMIRSADTSARAIAAGLIEALDARAAAPQYVQTGIPSLDDDLLGLYRGEVTVIAGKDGLGKTTFALNIVHNIVTRGQSVAVFSLEMSAADVMTVLLNISTGIPRKAFRKGDMTPAQKAQALEAALKAETWKLHVIDDSQVRGLTTVGLKRWLRRLMIDTPVDVVVVDGLWLMEGHDVRPGSARWEIVGIIMQELTAIAREYNVAIILLHQYNAEAMKRPIKERRPTTFDLSESSGVRYTAHGIIGLYRNKPYGIEVERDLTEAHILKWRGGDNNTGTVYYFDFVAGRYVETQP